MPSLRNALYSTIFIVAVVVGLSVFADVAYIYTLCGLSGWALVGHLVTLDDDMPGEWSNPEGSKALWHSSLFALLVKLLVFSVFLVLASSFPGLARYGA